MPSTLLDGPRIAPRSGAPARSLVVLLHGYGADGQDLIDLGTAWAEQLPETAFVAPDAPEPCGQAPMGRQWFALASRSPQERWDGVNAAAPVLQAFIDAELARLGLAPEALALVGFSQGCMMALHVGLRRATAPAGIVGYSGTLALPPGGGSAQIAGAITARPPVLLMHGSIDDVIPVAALKHAADALAALSIPVESHVVPAIGHAIAPREIRRGGEFLARCLRRSAGR